MRRWLWQSPGGTSREVVPTPDGDGTSEHYDVVIIGGGPGGYATALYGAAAGLSIAMVEKDKVGGTCLHRGCIPAKEFLETASVYRDGRRREGVRHPGGPADRRLRRQPRPQGQGRRPALQRALGPAEAAQGHDLRRRRPAARPARWCGSALRTAPGRDLTGTNVVLASGSVPRTIPGFEADGRVVLTSDEVLDLAAIPASGGGHRRRRHRLRVRLDDGRPRRRRSRSSRRCPSLLPGCDHDVADVVVRSFKKRGIDGPHRRRGQRPRASRAWHDRPVRRRRARRRRTLVIVSVGRRPLSDGLLAEGTGVELDERGFVRVDEWMRTGVDGVFAVGDLVATPQLAHVGFAEGDPRRQADPRRSRPSRSTTARSRGASTATPRSPSCGMTEQGARRRRLSTSSPRRTPSAATAGPASSARPTAS